MSDAISAGQSGDYPTGAVAYAVPRYSPTMRREVATRDHQPFLRRSRYIDSLARKLQEARAEREGAVSALLAYLGLPTVHPLDDGFQPLDLLSMVRVDGDHWIWTGIFNNKGSAVVYPHTATGRSYFGAPKIIHRAVTGEQHQATYQPLCDQKGCVRPSHRCATCATKNGGQVPRG